MSDRKLILYWADDMLASAVGVALFSLSTIVPDQPGSVPRKRMRFGNCRYVAGNRLWDGDLEINGTPQGMLVTMAEMGVGRDRSTVIADCGVEEVDVIELRTWSLQSKGRRPKRLARVTQNTVVIKDFAPANLEEKNSFARCLAFLVVSRCLQAGVVQAGESAPSNRQTGILSGSLPLSVPYACAL